MHERNHQWLLLIPSKTNGAFHLYRWVLLLNEQSSYLTELLSTYTNRLHEHD
jgi:hypothetical protein